MTNPNSSLDVSLPDRQDSSPALGAPRTWRVQERSLVRAAPFYYMRKAMRKYRTAPVSEVPHNAEQGMFDCLDVVEDMTLRSPPAVQECEEVYFGGGMR
eukprot:CAMPEP_0184709078 /NCGR_PEP_ID=MMETSP0314-20130426/329_1 /TAXON_ID=38298 /ORGANISM="Rhodella maculata, Strain CCMP 736" /LENGTH=98 /DNA_ID=CAMNT_0027170733 /DNA_START=54 /DNA_END=350 /DNA_ORIENTATION=+